ncbi:MAG: type II secretion system F family protein, partial [Nitrospirae bacterium]
MTRYDYRAVDQSGAVSEGTRLAVDVEDLERTLSQQGYYLIHAQARSSPNGSTDSRKTSGSMSRALVDFATQMSGLLNAGVPLLEALQSVARNAPTQELGKVLGSLCRIVESGTTLHGALAQYPRIFPPVVVNLVQAGEESGTLPDVFEELRQYLEWMHQLKSDMRQAMMYPSIVLAAVCGLLVLLFTFVIPRFIPVLAGLDIDLPGVTKLVFAVSETVAEYWWIGLVAGGMVPVLVFLSARYVPWLADRLDALKLKMPVVGEFMQLLALARFTQNFGVLFRAGVPILRCFRLCEGLVGNRVIAKAVRKAGEEVAEGASISDALSRHAVFPPMLIQMVAVGEASGKLAHTLRKVSVFYNQEIPRRVKKLFGVLEPAITLLLIGLVGLVALSIFLPIVSM